MARTTEQPPKKEEDKIDNKTYRALTDGGLPISSIDFLKM